jgi:hypothetical protein
MYPAVPRSSDTPVTWQELDGMNAQVVQSNEKISTTHAGFLTYARHAGHRPAAHLSSCGAL